MCLVFFRNFELISSIPADDVSLMFSIRDDIPSAKKETGSMVDAVKELMKALAGKSHSFAKTVEKALLKMSAHSQSLMV